KLPPALQAAPLARRQFQAAMAQPPRFMPHQPAIPALAPLVLAAAMRTGFRPGIPGRNPHLATRSLNPGNLVPRQAQNDLIVGQNVISQDCFTNLGSGPDPVFDQEPKIVVPRLESRLDFLRPTKHEGGSGGFCRGPVGPTAK